MKEVMRKGLSKLDEKSREERMQVIKDKAAEVVRKKLNVYDKLKAVE